MRIHILIAMAVECLNMPLIHTGIHGNNIHVEPVTEILVLTTSLWLIYYGTFSFVTSNGVRVSFSNQKTASVAKDKCFLIDFS